MKKHAVVVLYYEEGISATVFEFCIRMRH